MSSLRSVQTAIPSFSYDLSDIEKAGTVWLEENPEQLQKFRRFLRSSTTGKRAFVIPSETLLNQNGERERAAKFREQAPLLANQSVRAALKESGVHPQEADALIFTSCTCPAIPSVDTEIVHEQGFRQNLRRLPIYQHGCAGGVVGLSIANQFASAGDIVVLNSTELCSLVFRPEDQHGAGLVGAAIFADGSATAIVTPDDSGLVFVKTQSHLVRGTGHLMGYDIQDNGPHLRLDKELPSSLAEHVPAIVDSFLAQEGLTRANIPWWLFHPGGAKILDALEAIFELRPEQSIFAREVLQNHGNLSSATVLYVIKEFFDRRVVRPGDYALLVGVGPGITIETILFQYR